MTQIVDHYPGRPLPTDRRGVPIDGYSEQDVPELTNPGEDLDDTGAVALQEAVEAMQATPAEYTFGQFPDALQAAVVDMAHEEAGLRARGATPERIAAKTKKYLPEIGRLILIHKIPYDEVIQGRQSDVEQQVIDLAASRRAAAWRSYNDTLEREADKYGYNRAKEILESKGIFPPERE